MECKYARQTLPVNLKEELIDTLWNVNKILVEVLRNCHLN